MISSTLTVLSCVFFVSLSLSLVLIKYPITWLRDVAGDRSLHAGVIPRSGGLAILISLVIGLLMLKNEMNNLFTFYIVIAVFILVCISLMDDFISVSPFLRLVVQIMCATIIVFRGGLYFRPDISFPPMAFQVITVLSLVWMINLYNFMDGMDGFASGMAIIGFSSMGVLGYLHHDLQYAHMNAVLVAAVLGFWCLNFPPAKIFMGDMGSTVLGLLVGVYSLLGWQRGLFPLWVPALLFSPYWIDATYTVMKRILSRECFWLPHRSHFYQRLVLSGMSHRQVVVIEYILMLMCGLTVVLPDSAGLGYNYHTTYVWVGVYGLGILFLEKWLPPVNK